MKKKSLFLLAVGVLLAVFMTSCEDENTAASPLDPESGFWGTVKVGSYTMELNGQEVVVKEFVDEGVSVSIERSLEVAGKYDITMNDVKFSEQMPNAITLVIPGVDITSDGKISGDQIIPYVVLATGNVPYDRYLVTGLSGTLKANVSTGVAESVELSLNFGQYPTSYVGFAR